MASNEDVVMQPVPHKLEKKKKAKKSPLEDLTELRKQLDAMAEMMDEWTLDAYDDIQNKQIADPKGDFSYRAGKLIIDYFFRTHDVKILTTRHDIRNRAATVVCKRLGFKVTGKIYLTDIGEHIVMRLERPYGN